MAVKPVPDGYQQVIPYLCIDGAADAIEFYKQVFGATERMRFPGDDGRIGHAELEIGDSVVMLSDPAPDMGAVDPKTVGGTPVTVCLYLPGVDEVHAHALKLGATELRAVADQFYGDRVGMFEDPWGHRWSVSTHIEDLTPAEIAERAKASAPA